MTKNTILSIIAALLALAITVPGCCKKEDSTPEPDTTQDQVQVQPGVPMLPGEKTTESQPAIPLQPAIEATQTQPAEKTELWIQDFEEAKKLAADQGKDILINFTGSDWCKFCIMLEKEVFSQKAFIDAVPKKFVLLKLDFPKDESLITPEIKAQNLKLQKQYPFDGYPTVILTDAAGKHYAKTGFKYGGPEKYVKHLNELQESK